MVQAAPTTGRNGHGDAGVREDIFCAALACFDRHGMRRTTMDDVAAAAGVSRKTVYNYFDNKTSLVGEVVAREARRVADEARAELDLGLPAADLVVAAEMALLGAARRSPYVEMLLGPDAVTLTADAVDHSELIGKVQSDYWRPILEPLRKKLRTGNLAELIEWLTFFHFVLVARPATFEGSPERTRKMLRLYLVPAILR